MRIGKKQIIKILLNWDQMINPEEYPIKAIPSGLWDPKKEPLATARGLGLGDNFTKAKGKFINKQTEILTQTPHSHEPQTPKETV